MTGDRPAQAQAQAQAQPPAVVRPLPALAGRRVLVADDVEAVARSTARLLDLFGAVTTMATSGAQARELVARPWDLLVLDLHMGDTDGRELLRRARATRADVPAIFVSGAEPVDLVLPPRVTFLAKPFALARLLELVEGSLTAR
jgi:CheY-like chemotaxis protein